MGARGSLAYPEQVWNALILLACHEGAADSAAEVLEIPGHNECLPVGERFNDEVCIAVVEEQGRVPTESWNKAPVQATEDDPRLSDPEYQWVTGEIDRCACRCCHTTGLGGAGVHAWDLSFAPVWVDSASSWSLQVMGGWTEEYEQTLPASDIERLRVWIRGEWARREAVDGG